MHFLGIAMLLYGLTFSKTSIVSYIFAFTNTTVRSWSSKFVQIRYRNDTNDKLASLSVSLDRRRLTVAS
jgi:hypothetical protein